MDVSFQRWVGQPQGKKGESFVYLANCRFVNPCETVRLDVSGTDLLFLHGFLDRHPLCDGFHIGFQLLLGRGRHKLYRGRCDRRNQDKRRKAFIMLASFRDDFTHEPLVHKALKLFVSTKSHHLLAAADLFSGAEVFINDFEQGLEFKRRIS